MGVGAILLWGGGFPRAVVDAGGWAHGGLWDGGEWYAGGERIVEVGSI